MADSEDFGPPRVREGVRLQKVLSQAGIASRRVDTRRPRQHVIDYRVLLSDTGHVSFPRRFVCIDKCRYG